MTAAGERAVQQARASGAWTRLDPVEELRVPADLEGVTADVPRSG